MTYPLLSFKVGRSKPPSVLTSSSGQYAKKWSILVNTNLGGQLKILSGRFSGGLRYLVRFYVSFIEKRKNTVLSLPRALLTVRFQSQDLSTDFCIMPLQSRHLTLVFFHHLGQNRIKIQGLLHRFKTITVINL